MFYHAVNIKSRRVKYSFYAAQFDSRYFSIEEIFSVQDVMIYFTLSVITISLPKEVYWVSGYVLDYVRYNNLEWLRLGNREINYLSGSQRQNLEGLITIIGSKYIVPDHPGRIFMLL